MGPWGAIVGRNSAPGAPREAAENQAQNPPRYARRTPRFENPPHARTSRPPNSGKLRSYGFL
jgi:hypothetical protein